VKKKSAHGTCTFNGSSDLKKNSIFQEGEKKEDK
jgi:hypothetical protein